MKKEKPRLLYELGNLETILKAVIILTALMFVIVFGSIIIKQNTTQDQANDFCVENSNQDGKTFYCIMGDKVIPFYCTTDNCYWIKTEAFQ